MSLVGISTGVLGFVKNPYYTPKPAGTKEEENSSKELSPEAKENKKKFLEKTPVAKNTIDFSKNRDNAKEIEYRLSHYISSGSNSISSSDLYNNDLENMYTTLTGVSYGLQSAKDTMTMIERRETKAQDMSLSQDDKFVNDTYLKALKKVLENETGWTQNSSNWSTDNMVSGNNGIYGSNGRAADSLAKNTAKEILGNLSTESLGMENFNSMSKEEKLKALDKATQVINEKRAAVSQLYQKKTGKTLTSDNYVPVTEDKLPYAESSRIGGGMRIMGRAFPMDLLSLPFGMGIKSINIYV